MLLRIREVTAGKFSYFVVAVISVPFALWGVNYYFQGGSDPVVIEVGSVEVTLSQYNHRFNQMKREFDAALPPSETASHRFVKSEAIGALVRDGLLAQEADQYNYRVSDTALAHAIMELPEFVSDGAFDRQGYLDFLNAERYSQVAFEERIRRFMRNNQLRGVVTGSSFVLPSEREAYEKLLSQERHVRYVEFPMARYIDPGSVSSTSARTYYENNRDDFIESDKFNLRYMEVSADEIAENLVVDEDEARAFYRDNSAFFVEPERRTLAHILVDPGRHGQARERADEIYENLERGGDFAELARIYSDDSLTAEKGGELPPLTYGDVDEEAIEEVIFSLGEGEFSKPVESSFGFQVFKLIAVESSRVQTFEEARDTVYRQLRHDRADDLYSGTVEQLEIASEKHKFDLEPLKNELEMPLEIKSSGILDLDAGEGILRYPEIREVVVLSEVLEFGKNSGVMEVAPGHAFVVRVPAVGGYTPARQREYDEVKGEIFTTLLEDNAWVEVFGVTEAAAKQLKRGELTLAQLAETHSLPLRDPGFIRRDDVGVSPEMLEAAFAMPGVTSGTARVKMEDPGGYAVIEFVGMREGTVPDEAQPLSLGTREFNAVLLSLLERSSYKIHEDRLGEAQ